MFKVGDKVRRVRYNNNSYDISIGEVYTIESVNDDGITLKIINRKGDWASSNFELVEESNVNPCIKTEEVKVIKTKIITGYLEVGGLRDGRDKINLGLFKIGPSSLKGHAYLTCTSSRDQGSVSVDELRKLARQLDEIANVLETQSKED